jgi:RNA polymerase sigma factor (sigma-70 family)
LTRTCQTQRTKVLLEPIPRVNSFVAAGVNEVTLQSLFESEEMPLLRYAFSLAGRRAVAEEIVQEVFLQLHRHWDEIDCPKAWLIRSVRNRAFSYLRDHNREVLNEVNDNSQSQAESVESPEALLLRLEEIGALRKLVEELDEPDRELVKLKFFDNLRYRDISAQTGLSTGNVGYRLHHILKELAARLRMLGFDEKS